MKATLKLATLSSLLALSLTICPSLVFADTTDGTTGGLDDCAENIPEDLAPKDASGSAYGGGDGSELANDFGAWKQVSYKLDMHVLQDLRAATKEATPLETDLKQLFCFDQLDNAIKQISSIQTTGSIWNMLLNAAIQYGAGFLNNLVQSYACAATTAVTQSLSNIQQTLLGDVNNLICVPSTPTFNVSFNPLTFPQSGGCNGTPLQLLSVGTVNSPNTLPPPPPAVRVLWDLVQ